MILDKERAQRFLRSLAIALLAIGLTSCGATRTAQMSGPKVGAGHKLQVLATTSILAALVTAVAGDRAEVRSLVPVGASAENYEPSPQDIVALSGAQLLVENGAGLELWLRKMLAEANASAGHRIVLADGLPIAGRADNGYGNPHLWLDPVFAQAYVRKIAQGLSAADPANASYYGAGARREVARLKYLDGWIRTQIATVPAADRAMITFHDAWYYFDRRYGIRDIGAVELSPGQEPSAGYFAHLVELARRNHVRAVFAEPQFSPKLVKELADSAGIATVENLYDDTTGSTPQLSTYEGVMRYDASTIARSLRS